jgi:UDP-glucose 4-epimerase
LAGSPLKPVFREQRKLGDAEVRRACTEKAARMLGFRTQVNLEEGLRRLVAWRHSAVAALAAGATR